MVQSHERRSISVVTPVYNGEASVGELCRRLAEVLPRISAEHEVILVNDGSRDRSWETISELCSRSPMVRGLNLMRNYGQHNALLCGIRAARYEVIVTMDDDLQHSPEEIPRLLARLEEGFDVVYGAPKAEQNGLMRALASRITRLALSAAVGSDVAKNVSAFRVFPHTIARGIRSLSVSFCFHRRAAYMGNNALRRDDSCFPAAPFGLFKLQFHKTGSPCTRYDDRLQHRPVTAREPNWIYMHAVWACRLHLRFCPLLPRGKRAWISVSGLNHCNLFRCPAFRPGSHR